MGTWYKGMKHQEIPDTGVRKSASLLPRTGSSQMNEALAVIGVAGIAAAALNVLVK